MDVTKRESAIDEALIESFPASDPPSWTLGVSVVAPPERKSDPDERKGRGTTGGG